MKKLLVAAMMVLFSATSFAQYSSGGFSLSESSVYYGLRLGLNVSTITGDRVDVDSKAGLGLGGVVGLRVSDSTPIFLESGLYFSGRGGKDFTMNYLELPILMKYGVQVSDDIAVLPYIGPYFSLGVGGEYKYPGVDKDGNAIVKKDSSFDVMNRADVGIKVGCGAEYNKLYLELGYQFGITDIAKDNPQDKSAHTGNFFVNLGVNF